MAHLVSVSQLRSTDDNAYLNVSAEHGRVLVWTCTYGGLTFLLRSSKSGIVQLVQFSSAGWAYEWLLANARWFDEIEVL